MNETSTAVGREPGRLERPLSARTRGALALLFVLLTAFNAAKAYRNAASGVTSDLRTYYVAAEDMRQGETPYQHRAWLNDYIYPPFFCWAFAPLTWMPIEWAAVAWAVFNGGLWLLAAWLALQAIPLPGWLAVLPSLFTIRFILNNWGHGQVNLLLLCLVLASLVAHLSGRPLLSGAFIGAGIAVKIIPALFLLFHLVERSWKALTMAALAAILLVAAPALTHGPPQAGRFLQDWTEMFGRHTTDVSLYNTSKNQSLFGAMMRFLTPVDAIHYSIHQGMRVNLVDLDPTTVGRIFLATSLALAGLLTLAMAAPGPAAIKYALLFVALPMFSKTAMEHHWVMLLYVYTCILGSLRDHPRLWWPVGLSLLLTNLHSKAFLGRYWGSWLQAYSPSTWALFVLGGTLLWLLRESGREVPPLARQFSGEKE